MRAYKKISKGLIAALAVAVLTAKAYAADVSAYSHVLVEDASVKMGNIFTNLSVEDSSKELFKAPEVGKKFTLTPQWLSATAKQFGYTFTAAPGKGVTIIERATDTIRAEDVSHFIAGKLKEQGYATNAVVELDNRNLQIPIAQNTAKDISLTKLSVNNASKKFTAELSVKQDETSSQQLTIAGRFDPLVKIPVVSTQKVSGDVINKDDITYLSLRTDSVSPQHITTADKLIGMTPKRSLAPETPIRLTDVQTPILVKKNDTVTVTLASQGMAISMKGRAMQDGSKGDVIRILNPVSKREIEGSVTGLAEVRIENMSAGTIPVATTQEQGFTN